MFAWVYAYLHVILHALIQACTAGMCTYMRIHTGTDQQIAMHVSAGFVDNVNFVIITPEQRGRGIKPPPLSSLGSVVERETGLNCGRQEWQQ